MLMKVSPPGSVNTVIEVDSITLYPKYDASKTFLVLMTVGLFISPLQKKLHFAMINAKFVD